MALPWAAIWAVAALLLAAKPAGWWCAQLRHAVDNGADRVAQLADEIIEAGDQLGQFILAVVVQAHGQVTVTLGHRLQ